MSYRRIRVHLAELSTFVVTSYNGIVIDVSLETERWALDKHETVVATYYRNKGAKFVDLIQDRTVVRVAGGYRSRNTLPRLPEPRKLSPRGESAPAKAGKRGRGVPPSNPQGNAIIDSLRNWSADTQGDTSLF